MATLTLELPDRLMSELHQSLPEVESDVRLAAAIDWYRRGLVSQGRAAELAGVARADFIDQLAVRKIDVITVDLREIEAEMGLG